MTDRPAVADAAPPTTHPDPSGLLVIISGPSGVGKSTITNAVVERLGAQLSISKTTRPRAATDVDGQHYFFVSREQFERDIAHDAFLEWAEVYGNYYGTPRPFVESHLHAGKLVVLEIDVKGALIIKDKLPEAFAIFILAPGEQALLDRLRTRNRDDEATIQRRFARARAEISDARESGVYTFIINDDFHRAVDVVCALIEGQVMAQRLSAAGR
jgi:guanylate kinase